MVAENPAIDRRTVATVTPDRGAVSPIAEVRDRTRARVAGTVRAVTLRPPSTAAAFEAILDDGSGALRVVWMGQRDIPGIGPGRRLLVEGRVSFDVHGPTMRDPRYELLPGGTP
ncbi:MAG: OB-fold nucleic acid binding domain-containing protein [Bifidobacteriaceae bacterium]|jgi:hypothetical protein|nr:OB-fold nucleic acid binding domain-containing protein [Bifidobacteriaceae bacterium]